MIGEKLAARRSSKISSSGGMVIGTTGIFSPASSENLLAIIAADGLKWSVWNWLKISFYVERGLLNRINMFWVADDIMGKNVLT